MIEDDLELADMLKGFLQTYNIQITNYDNPELGMSALNIDKYDLLILDLSLPGIDGLDICKEINDKHDIPIIISSARADIADKAACFQCGADDYLPKPYDPRELVMRINAVVKRYRTDKGEEAPTGRFSLDEEKRMITMEGEALKLTKAEFEILSYLIKRQHAAVSREEILDNVDSIRIDSGVKSIDVIIARIRQKIEKNPKSPKHIIAIRGVGFTFNDD